MSIDLAELGFSLSGKTCLVTGAAQGLGEHLAHVLAKAGAAYIALLDMNEAQAQQTAKSIVASCRRPIELVAHGCNITEEESVAKAFDIAVQRTGRMDVVVNAAGIPAVYPAVSHPIASAQAVMNVNVNGSLIVARQAALAMQMCKRGGSIILVASMSASVVNIPQTQAVYNASKAAVKHLASSLAVEWAPFGIRINSISPGYLETAQTQHVDPAVKNVWVQRTPLRRMGRLQDIGGPIVFLGSDASAFMTGTDMLVDGGYCTL